MKRIFSTLAFIAFICTFSFAQGAPKIIKLLPPTYDEGMTLMQAQSRTPKRERREKSGFRNPMYFILI